MGNRVHKNGNNIWLIIWPRLMLLTLLKSCFNQPGFDSATGFVSKTRGGTVIETASIAGSGSGMISALPGGVISAVLAETEIVGAMLSN